MIIKTAFVLLIFLGSIFCTSEKFVDSTTTPKNYFVVILLLVSLLFISITKKRICIDIFSSKYFLWGINIICFIQACYGISQFIGCFQPSNTNFEVTGSFDNPVGFAAVLAMGVPVSLKLLEKSTKNGSYLVISNLITTLIAVFLSGSRTGLLAILIAIFTYIYFYKKNIFSKFNDVIHNRLQVVLLIGLIIGGGVILHSQKKDSSNGRLLIWEVSAIMINNKPFFGHGYGAFKAKYMDYQAEYFKNKANSKFSQLADNVKFPFSEFIKVSVEFGIIGLAILLSVIILFLLKVIKTGNENRVLVLSGLATLGVLSSFSYPLRYISIWLMLAFYLALILPSKEIMLKNTSISIIARVIVVIACAFFLFYFTKQLQAEMKWKKIAVCSLAGNTEEMLPEYEKLYSTSFRQNPFFLYNYGAELNVASQFDKSIKILIECQKQFNDFDLLMLLADNYEKKGEIEKAIQIYKQASNMIPCRFIPIYQLFEIYRGAGQKYMAAKYANEIVNKKVKIPSLTVYSIKVEAKKYLEENEITFGNKL